MTINNLSPEQREAFARYFLRTLYELWCDQHGIEAEIIIERKEEAPDN